MVAAGSFVVFVMTTAAIARSFFTTDLIAWSSTTAEPLTPRAEQFAARQGLAATAVARQLSWSVRLVRGRIVMARYENREPMAESDAGRLLQPPMWRRETGSAISTAQDWWAVAWLGRLGFAEVERVSATRLYAVYRGVSVPLWPIALITAIPPVIVMRRVLRRWLRRRGGRCVGCGYDLHETPEGRRCPECGMLPESAPMPEYTRPPRATALPR
jgi:hypothetical protein